MDFAHVHHQDSYCQVKLIIAIWTLYHDFCLKEEVTSIEYKNKNNSKKDNLTNYLLFKLVIKLWAYAICSGNRQQETIK